MSAALKERPETIAIHVVAVVVRLRLIWNNDQIERVEATGPVDSIRERAIKAVNIGLQNGRQLQHQALQALAVQELIAGLIRTEQGG